MKLRLFWISYIAVTAFGISGLAYLIIRHFDVGPEWLLFVVVSSLPVAYIGSLRCANCGNLIYTGRHIAKTPGRGFLPPLHVFRNCPECNAPLDTDEAFQINGWPFGKAADFGSMGWKFVVGIGAMGLLATAGATVAHYIFGAPIDIGDQFIISQAFTIALFLVACAACSLLAIAVGALFRRTSR